MQRPQSLASEAGICSPGSLSGRGTALSEAGPDAPPAAPAVDGECGHDDSGVYSQRTALHSTATCLTECTVSHCTATGLNPVRVSMERPSANVLPSSSLSDFLGTQGHLPPTCLRRGLEGYWRGGTRRQRDQGLGEFLRIAGVSGSVLGPAKGGGPPSSAVSSPAESLAAVPSPPAPSSHSPASSRPALPQPTHPAGASPVDPAPSPAPSPPIPTLASASRSPATPAAPRPSPWFSGRSWALAARAERNACVSLFGVSVVCFTPISLSSVSVKVRPGTVLR